MTTYSLLMLRLMLFVLCYSLFCETFCPHKTGTYFAVDQIRYFPLSLSYCICRSRQGNKLYKSHLLSKYVPVKFLLKVKPVTVD